MQLVHLTTLYQTNAIVQQLYLNLLSINNNVGIHRLPLYIRPWVFSADWYTDTPALSHIFCASAFLWPWESNQ